MLAAGCSKDSGSIVPEPPVPPTPSNPTTEKLEIKISPSVKDSRATDYGFESGDCIGLYVVNYSGSTPGSLATTGNHVDNMRFTYNGSWVPDTPIYWGDNATHADFYLYYPYAAVQSVSAHPFAVKADQSTEAANKASDMMVGKTVDVAPSSSTTVIPVNHVMSRILIYLEAGNGFTAESLAAADVSVKINGVKTNSTVNIATGAVTPTGDATTVTPLFADNVYKALIVPQTVGEGNLITVNVDGHEYNLKKGFTFESARSHKFTVTVSKTSNGVNVNINPWSDDGIDHGGTAE
ncbi:MAG: fimbrillin family protein [Muribaculaceae bacterium]|nr:fimbrillin family protein [Muribaculaceae bacterium]